MNVSYSHAALVQKQTTKKSEKVTLKKRKKKLSAWQSLPQHVTIRSLDEPKKTSHLSSSSKLKSSHKKEVKKKESDEEFSQEDLEMLQAINDVFSAAAANGGDDFLSNLFGGSL